MVLEKNYLQIIFKKKFKKKQFLKFVLKFRLKGIVVNCSCKSLNRGTLKITSTVPLKIAVFEINQI